MATYAARDPASYANSAEQIALQAVAQAYVRAPATFAYSVEFIYPFSAPTTPLRMRAKAGASYVYWYSMNSQPDTIGRFYYAASPAFSTLTEIKLIGVDPTVVQNATFIPWSRVFTTLGFGKV